MSEAEGKIPTANKFHGLEAGRGIAALAVLLAHATILVAEPRFYGTQPFSGLFLKFGAGVDFFFVLSGFIICWSHWQDIGQPGRLGRYARRRFFRIYPAYWAILLPLSLAYFLMPGTGDPSQHDPVNFLFSFFLLPYPEHPILGVAWTLVFEMAFYTIFALLILWGHRAFAILVLWGVLVVVAHLLYAPLTFPCSFVADVHNIEFIFGVVLAVLLRRYRVPAPRLAATIGALGFLAMMLVDHPLLDEPLIGRIGYGLAACLAMAGAVEWDRTRGLSVGRPWLALGSASYALYLVHGVVISIGIQVLVRVLPRDVPLALLFTLLVLAGVTGGLAYHHLVERPLARWLSRWRNGRMNDAVSAEASLVR